MGRIKFGLIIPQGWKFDLPDSKDPHGLYKSIERTARNAEEIGFDSVALFDHFHTVPSPAHYPVFECWTTLAALAASTDQIGLSECVTCNSYRNPAYLAKITSIVDVISDGRLELGIGAGWYEHEYDGYGYDFEKPSVRIGMLEEAVQIIKSMWTQGSTHFNGEYYKLGGALNYPKPVQDPHPPIMIGGGGEQLTLRVVAKHADIWNGGWDLDTYEHKLEVLQGHCEAVDRDYEDITKSYISDLFVAPTREKAVKLLKDWKDRQSALIGEPVDFDMEEYRERNAVGDPEEVLDRLTGAKELGATHFLLDMPNAADRELMELLYDEVVEPLRSA
jgi:F420-dependent oxidoreductase-like protein